MRLKLLLSGEQMAVETGNPSRLVFRAELLRINLFERKEVFLSLDFPAIFKEYRSRIFIAFITS